MNGIAATMLLNMTSSMRFEGSLNVDLNDITMNLVPFPQVRMRYEGQSRSIVVSGATVTASIGVISQTGHVL
jgi:hypothetical protein